MDSFVTIREVDMKSAPGPSASHEPIGKGVGLAFDRGIEHLDGMRIILVREHRAFCVQHELVSIKRPYASSVSARSKCPSR
jgi:hypothetical protein